MKNLCGLFLTIAACSCFATTTHLQTVTVMLDGAPGPDHAPLVVAAQQGFFKQQGLDVKLISPTQRGEPASQVSAGKADMALVYQPDFVQDIDHGKPLIRIGTLIDKPLNCMVVLKDSGISSFADLKGKTIGTSNSSFSAALLKSELSKQHIAVNAVKMISQNGHATDALLSHQVDAVTGVTCNVEVPQLEAKGLKVITLLPEDYGVPNFSELIFVTHVAKTHDQRWPHFMAAVKQAVAYLDTHPQQSWQRFAKRYPEANNAVNRAAWFATIPYFAEDPANFDNEQWGVVSQYMHDNRLIKSTQPASRYAADIAIA